jgi:hypothetical protein
VHTHSEEAKGILLVCPPSLFANSLFTVQQVVNPGFPHDRLFLDPLERDLKHENMGFEPATTVVGEPALSFMYDPWRSLHEQFSMAQFVMEVDGDANRNIRVPQMNRVER